MISRRSAARVFTVWTVSALSFTACNPGDTLGLSGNSNGHFTPDYSMAAPAHRSDLLCGDGDASHLCIALKYVAFQDSSGQATVSRTQAVSNIKGINSLWSQCHIQFYLENYSAVDPRSAGMAYQSTTNDDLQSARSAYSDSSTMLVVTTGEWAGTLGAQSANAWTAMPAIGPFGVVMESPVSGYANLVAHELGHYLNLQHASDQFNVMNPVVYSNSLNITDSQCTEARATAISFWGAVLR